MATKLFIGRLMAIDFPRGFEVYEFFNANFGSFFSIFFPFGFCVFGCTHL
jgi:hypothetical protein